MITLYKPDNRPFESIEQAEEYLRDNVHEIFNVNEWTQGDFCDNETITVQVQDKYYNVSIEVETIGERQDVGPKLYHIEQVKSVTFTEVTQEQIEKSIDARYYHLRRELQQKLDTLAASEHTTWLAYGFPDKQPLVVTIPRKEGEVKVTKVEIIGRTGVIFTKHLSNGFYVDSIEDAGSTLKLFEWKYDTTQPNQAVEQERQELIEKLVEHRQENADLEWLLQNYKDDQETYLSELSLTELKDLVDVEIA